MATWKKLITSGSDAIVSSLKVGSDGIGGDVTFYSDTAGDNFFWDASDEKLVLTGTNGQTALDVADGNVVIDDTLTATNIAAFNLTGKLTAGSTEIEGSGFDINGGAIDAVTIGTNTAATQLVVDNINIDGTTIGHTSDTDLMTLTSGALLIKGTVTVGVDGTGADVRFYSETSNEGLLYDASEDELGLLLTTKLKFHDIGGAEEIYASSNGHLEINSGTTLDMTAPTVDINASTAVTIDGPSVTIANSAADTPILHITNTHAGATSGEIRFNKDSTGDDNDVMGKISWFGTDSSDNTYEELAYMDAIITDSAHGSEASSLRFYVAENDATRTLGLQLAGQADADGEIDVTIGAGAASTAIIAGTLTMGSTAAMTNAGLVSVANQ